MCCLEAVFQFPRLCSLPDMSEWRTHFQVAFRAHCPGPLCGRERASRSGNSSLMIGDVCEELVHARSALSACSFLTCLKSRMRQLLAMFSLPFRLSLFLFIYSLSISTFPLSNDISPKSPFIVALVLILLHCIICLCLSDYSSCFLHTCAIDNKITKPLNIWNYSIVLQQFHNWHKSATNTNNILNC